MSRKASGDQKIESIEPHLKNAVKQTRKSKGTVVEAQNLWNRPVERAKGDEWYLEGTSSYTGKNKTESRAQRLMRSEIWRFAATAAATLLVIAGLSYYQLLVRVDTSVYLDVNPSFTLSLNRLDRVVGAESDNEEAQEILAQTDLKDKEIDEAMELLFEAMGGQGYFSGEENTVLLSVEGGSSARVTQMSEDLSEEIEGYLDQNTTGGAVFCQTVHIDEETREFAKSHSISSGKAALALKLSKEYPEQDKEQMASFTMDELVKHLHDQNIDLRDSLDYRGEDLDQRWKREEERKEAGEQTPDRENDQESGQGSDQRADQGTRQSAGPNTEQGAGPNADQETDQDNSETEPGGKEKTAPDEREGTGPELSQESLRQNAAGENAQEANDTAAKTTEEFRGTLTPGQETPSEQ